MTQGGQLVLHYNMMNAGRGVVYILLFIFLGMLSLCRSLRGNGDVVDEIVGKIGLLSILDGNISKWIGKYFSFQVYHFKIFVKRKDSDKANTPGVIG